MRRSKALKEAGYDAAARVLRVRFRDGRRGGGRGYDYLDVPPEIWEGLRDSEHPWTEWGEQIKTTYDYRPLD